MPRVKPVFIETIESAKPFSDSLAPGNSEILNAPFEIRRYLELHTSAYLNSLETVCRNSIGSTGNAKTHICIPSGHEGKNITRTLSCLAAQPATYLRDTEVRILDNHRNTESADNTQEEVAVFCTSHPEINVVSSYITVPESMPFGNIRKILFDSVIFGIANDPITESESNHTLVSCDADVYGFSDNYLSVFAGGINRNTPARILVGSFQYPQEALRQYPLLAAAFQFHRTFRTLKEQNRNYVPWTSGRATAFSAEVYAAVGGLNGVVNRSSDTEIGHRVNRMMNLGYEITIERGDFYIETDPRRVLTKMSLEDRNYSDEFEDPDWTRQKQVYGKSWQDGDYPMLERPTIDGLEKEWGGILIKKAFRRGAIQHLRDLSSSEKANLNKWVDENSLQIQTVLNHMGVSQFSIDTERETIIKGVRIPRILILDDISDVERNLSA